MKQLFLEHFPLTDRQLKQFDDYESLLRSWQKTINLVGPKTLSDVWGRHFLDSAQLWPHLPAGARRLVDLGSGAGFPGLVLAIMGVPDVHLIESDQRKAAFLREVARTLDLGVTVHAARLESINLTDIDVITARALAPLSDLLAWGEKFVSHCSIGLFPKGEKATEEIANAAEIWHFECALIPSLTEKKASIISVVAPWLRLRAQSENVRRADDYGSTY